MNERLQLFEGYIETKKADCLLKWALTTVTWECESIVSFGRSIRVPRKVSWFGDHNYSYTYSGIQHVASGWPDELVSIKNRISKEFECKLNFVLLNLYENGNDYMGWHADNEAGLLDPIVSLSLGATRDLLIKTNSQSNSEKIELQHGTLLVHGRSLRHTLPKRKNCKEKRINLSFRGICANAHGQC